MDFGERLARSQAGDQAARTELFSRWQSLLTLQARRLLGQQLAARVDPADVVQEAFLQATREWESFRGQTEGEWVGWLQSMLRGHATRLRRQHLAARRDVGRTESLAFDQPRSARTPLGEAMDHEQARRLAVAIAALPTMMREVVIGRTLEQRSFDEIAAALGCTAGAARVTWTRALRKLRELCPQDSSA
jgi:RNA polymerase sigma-70 factor (ECF subfamily)